MQDRVPPQNIEAEQSVIGAMLIDKNAVSVVTEKLMPEDFYRQAHQVIYSAMLTLHSKNEPIDMITLIDELKKMNKLDDVGGVSYVTLLANIVPTAANAKFHAQIVEEKSVLRQLVEGGTAKNHPPDFQPERRNGFCGNLRCADGNHQPYPDCVGQQTGHYRRSHRIHRPG